MCRKSRYMQACCLGGQGRLIACQIGPEFLGGRHNLAETRAGSGNGHNRQKSITNGWTSMATEDLKARLEALAQTITQYQVRL